MPKIVVTIDAGVTHEVITRPPVVGVTNQRTGASYPGITGLQTAVAAATPGDTLEVDAATYSPFNLDKSLAIKAKTGAGSCKVSGVGLPASAAIIGIDGVGISALIEDCEIFGNKVLDVYNAGIGIRQANTNLTLRRCVVHDNSNGFLGSAPYGGGVVLFEDCEFYDNGDWSGLQHNIYATGARLTMRRCWSHMKYTRADPEYVALYGSSAQYESCGHLVKSRCAATVIENSRILQQVGRSNRCIDLPNGGDVTVRNCVLEMNAGNWTNNYGGQAVSYGVEEKLNPAGHTLHRFVFENNVVINHGTEAKQWLFIRTDADGVPAPSVYSVKGNVFVGFKAPLVLAVAGAEGDVYQPSATDNIFISREEMDARMPGHATGDYTLIGAPPVTPPAGTWGVGTDVGTLANNVWTPGVDATGIVNKVSWDRVPLKTLLSVAGTRIDALDAAVKAALPGWYDVGDQTWSGILAAMHGMAWDTRPGSERGFLGPAGGHAATYNDGIYRFTLRKMKWEIQRLPTLPDWWPSAYRTQNNSGWFPPAGAVYEANHSNVEGVWYDEFYDPSNLTRSNRGPCARHLYSASCFVPTLGTGGKILMGNHRYWEYDVALNSWAHGMFPFGEQATFGAQSIGYTDENMQGWYNPVLNRYYVCATSHYPGPQYIKTYSVIPGGTGWKVEDGFPVGGYDTKYTAGEKVGSAFWILVYDNDNSLHGKPYKMHQILDSTARNASGYPKNIKIGNSLSGVAWASDWWDGQGMTYVADVGKWFVATKNSANKLLWCWLDPATWTLELASDIVIGSYPADAQDSLVYVETKIKYIPGLHAVMWMSRAAENVRLIRFA